MVDHLPSFAAMTPMPELRPNVIRPGDVVISSGVKAGTTFTRQLVHQLRTKGQDVDFEDLSDQVPFMQFQHHPYETWTSRLNYYRRKVWSKEDHSALRVVASHELPRPLLLDVKYIVTFRNPHEVHDSYSAFYNSLSDDMRELWGGCLPAKVSNATFEFMWTKFLSKALVANYINGWWPFRNVPRVLFLHYTDMTRDLNATAIKIAKHLGIALTRREMAKVIEHSSFDWMKAHASKFDGSATGWPSEFIAQGFLKPGFHAYDAESLTRLGKSGEFEVNKRTRAYEAQLKLEIPDDATREWLYYGGDFL